MKVYVSGPMTGYPEHNYPAFKAAAKKLREAGFETLDPSENYDGKDGLPRAAYFRLDAENVLRADAVVVLPNWQDSRGARLEVMLANELGLPVYDYTKSQFSGQAVDLRPAELGIFGTGGRGDPRFHALLQRIADLHDKKQTDYGKATDPFANVRASKNWGVKPWVGALVRLNDKVSRLQSFAQKGSLANESAEDSMMDIAVYALIALILYKEESYGESQVIGRAGDGEANKPTQHLPAVLVAATA